MRKVGFFFLIWSLLPIMASDNSYIPHFTFINGWDTNLTLSNMGSGAAEVTLTAWSDNGEAFNSKTLIIEGYEGRNIDLQEQLPGVAGKRGWLSLEGADQIRGLMTFSFVANGGATSLPITSQTGKSMVLPLVENGENMASGFAVVNPQESMTPVEFRLVDLDNGFARSVFRELPGKSKLTLMTADLFDGTLPPRARLEIYAEQELTGFALTFKNGNQQIVAVPASHWDAGDQPAIRRALEAIMDGHPGGASLAIQRGDGPLITAAAGWAHQDQEAMTPNHASQLGSVTKSMVATVILMLHEEGTININAPLSNWFPLFPRAERITLRHLLNHSSGIPDYLTEQYYLDIRDEGGHKIWSSDELLAYSNAEEPLYEPGTMGSYSNTNYLLLAMVIEQVSGQSLAQQLRARIFEPLGMRHTYLRGFETPAFPVAHGYLWDPQHIYYEQNLTDTSNIINGTSSLGDGGVGSTVEDLITFARALFKGGLLRDETLAEMMEAYEYEEGVFGLGLQILAANDMPLFGHTGSFVWGNSMYFYVPHIDSFWALTRNVIVVEDDEAESVQLDVLILCLEALGLLDENTQNTVQKMNFNP